MQFLSQPSSIVEKFIFQAIDILRGNVSTSEYHVIGLILFLRKEGYTKNVVNLHPENAKHEFSNCVRQLYGVEKGQFRFTEKNQIVTAIFDAFKGSINKLDSSTLYYLIQLVESLGEEHLNLYFVELIETLVYRVAKLEGRFGGEYLQPVELTRFISALTSDLPDKASVYNPFAGAASFGVYLKKGVHYFGQEINRLSWAIGMIRLFASDRERYSDFVIGDSIKNWNPYAVTHDLIIANPPFGMMVSNGNATKTPSYTDVFVIEKSLRSLTSRGKAVFILPNNFLFSTGKGYQAIRRELVKGDLLEMVIAFPGGLLMNTSIPFCILFINQDKMQKGKVLFVNAETSVREISKKNSVIDVERLLSVVHDGSHQDAKLIHKDEIMHNDFILSVNRYLTKDLPEIKGEQLESILKLVRGTKAGESVIGKLIRIKDLKNDRRDFELNTNALEELEIPRYAVRLEKSALLLTIRWRTLKPTYFEYRGEPIFVSPDVVAYEVDESKVDIAYLIHELTSDYVTTQLNRYRTGTTIPYIPKEDLLKVKIELPELRVQRAKITGTAFQILEAERAAIKKQAYEELASIKHSMGKPLLNLNSGVKNIEAVLSKLNKDWESVKLSSKADYTLRDAINSLLANLNLLSNLLKNNERELDVGTYTLSEINAIHFFQQYISDLKVTDGDKYELKLDISPDLQTEFQGGIFIKANEELLRIAFNNIIDNAQRHGFIQLGKDYNIEVRLGLQLEKDSAFLKIEVANNGEPFPKKFTLEKLIRKASIAGSTGNSGIGGHDISEIVKRHGGKLDIITDPEVAAPFSTIYEILIPINASNGNSE